MGIVPPGPDEEVPIAVSSPEEAVAAALSAAMKRVR
jgi:hypothetical protein